MDQKINNAGSVNGDGTPNIVPPPATPQPSPEFKAPSPMGMGQPPKPATPPPAMTTMQSDLDTVAPTPKAPGAAVFDGSEPAFTPETSGEMSGGTYEPVPEGHHRVILWIIAGIVLVAVLLLGYFFIYPLFKKAPEPVVPVAEVPVTENPEPVMTYVSRFITTPQARVTPAIAVPITRETIQAALVAEAANANAGLTEVVLMNEGEPVAGPALFEMLSGQNNGSILSLFGSPATAFLYKDDQGSWPGYVFTLNTPSDATALAQLSTALETAGTPENFFIVTPGELGTFTDGSVLGLADRYAAGATPGASFGYLIHENTFLIGTSFAGMKEAMRLLNLGTAPVMEAQ